MGGLGGLELGGVPKPVNFRAKYHPFNPVTKINDFPTVYQVLPVLNIPYPINFPSEIPYPENP